MTDSPKVKSPKRKQNNVGAGTPAKKAKTMNDANQVKLELKGTPNKKNKNKQQGKKQAATNGAPNGSPAKGKGNKKQKKQPQTPAKKDATTTKSPEQNEKRQKFLQKKRLRIKMKKQKLREDFAKIAKGDTSVETENVTKIEYIEKRIKEFESRDNLSKTASRKLKYYQKLLQIKEGQLQPTKAGEKKAKQEKKKQNPLQKKAEVAKPAKAENEDEEEDDDDDDDDDDDMDGDSDELVIDQDDSDDDADSDENVQQKQPPAKKNNVKQFQGTKNMKNTPKKKMPQQNQKGKGNKARKFTPKK